ncbi:PP2C family serine/threonine-protein phosphatase [Massilia luteola]|uniref:PP2C family protein-serine/threonine phosphatase n=1 Tax=Massilia luteola TaxID=3081751 RepID=UPI002ACC27C1|nr:PP2C family serine/threonine-protein phosphatase [Massilia sp. Gc5]
MSCDAAFHWTSAALTDVGRVRSRNEDACLAQPQRGLWAVADGMGGHAFGDVASRTVVEALDRLPPPSSLARFIDAARDAIVQVNGTLRAEARTRHVPVMGSTVVALLACGTEAACLWAGDSRIYLYRSGRLQQLTRDHSQAAALQARGFDAAAAAVGANMITRAVGASDTLDVEVTTLTARDGDIFLLCSDGLSNPVPEQDIREALACGDCAHAAQTLVGRALANGGRDNVTVVVVRASDMSSDRTLLNPAL